MNPTLLLPLLLVLTALHTASAASPIADVLKPFVEKEELAGAVALVANKDKVLAVEAGEGAKAQGAFKQAAEAQFAKKP